MIKGQTNTCPHCSGNNINYGVLEIYDDMVAYPAECEDCKTVFVEWYEMVYKETVITATLEEMENA